MPKIVLKKKKFAEFVKFLQFLRFKCQFPGGSAGKEVKYCVILLKQCVTISVLFVVFSNRREEVTWRTSRTSTTNASCYKWDFHCRRFWWNSSMISNLCLLDTPGKTQPQKQADKSRLDIFVQWKPVKVAPLKVNNRFTSTADVGPVFSAL